MAGFTSHADRSVAVSKMIMPHITRYGDMMDNWPTMLSSGLKNAMESLESRAVSNTSAICIQVKDLEEGAGDHVEVPIVHDLYGLPTMGNRVAEGTGEAWSESSYSLKIDQTRKAVDLRTKLDQQRRGYSLTKTGVELGKTYYTKLETERMIYHFTGRRGMVLKHDQIIPLHVDGPINTEGLTFNELMINPLRPPTNNRTFFGHISGNDPTSIDGTAYNSTKRSEAMTSVDVITPYAIRNWKQQLEEMEHPLQKAKFDIKHEHMADTTPMYYGWLTPAQWTTLDRAMGVSGMKEAHANAIQRTKGWNHPLFKGDAVMIEDIYFQKYLLPVSYRPGDRIPMRDDDAVGTVRQETVPAGFNVDVGFIVGAGAIAKAYGHTVSGGGAWDMDVRQWDGKSRKELILTTMGGLDAVEMKDVTGKHYTRGIISILSATPERLKF